jgi:hypothetical protein
MRSDTRPTLNAQSSTIPWLFSSENPIFMVTSFAVRGRSWQSDDLDFDTTRTRFVHDSFELRDRGIFEPRLAALVADLRLDVPHHDDRRAEID